MAAAVIDALMFGSFSYFILIIFIIVIFAAVLIRRALGVLMVPVCVLTGIMYLNQDLGWHGLLMFLAGIFIVLFMAAKKDG